MINATGVNTKGTNANKRSRKTTPWNAAPQAPCSWV